MLSREERALRGLQREGGPPQHAWGRSLRPPGHCPTHPGHRSSFHKEARVEMGRAPSPNQSLGTWGRRVPPLLAHLASHSTTCRLQGPPLKGTSRFTGVTQAGLHTALGTTDPTSRAPVQHLAHSSPGGTPPLGGEVRKVEAGGAIWGQTKQEREQDTQMFRKKFPPGAPWGPPIIGLPWWLGW